MSQLGDWCQTVSLQFAKQSEGISEGTMQACFSYLGALEQARAAEAAAKSAAWIQGLLGLVGSLLVSFIAWRTIRAIDRQSKATVDAALISRDIDEQKRVTEERARIQKENQDAQQLDTILTDLSTKIGDLGDKNTFLRIREKLADFKNAHMDIYLNTLSRCHRIDHDDRIKMREIVPSLDRCIEQVSEGDFSELPILNAPKFIALREAIESAKRVLSRYYFADPPG